METQSPQVPSALRPKQPNFPMKLKINASGKYQKMFISKAAETLSKHELLKDLQKFQSDSMIPCAKKFFLCILVFSLDHRNFPGKLPRDSSIRIALFLWILD